MPHWKTESDDTKVPHFSSLAGSSWRRKGSVSSTSPSPITSGHLNRMGSTGTGCEDVSSSISDSTSASVAASSLRSKTNGILCLGKENEYDFESSEAGNEADSFVPTNRNGRASHQPASTNVLGLHANSVSTSTDSELPSNSGIPFLSTYTRQHFLKEKNPTKPFRDKLCITNELPSCSGSPSDVSSRKNLPANKKNGMSSEPVGSVFGGDATYMNNFKTHTPVVSSSFPTHARNSWTLANRNSSPEPDRPPGDVGLHNMGNTCFMNSGLQCLLHSPSLVEYFLKLNLDGVNMSSVPIVCEFQFFMQHAWFGLMKSIYITNFRNKVVEACPQFKDGRQHDCQEFLALMLDSLHEQLKSLTVQKSSEVNEEFNQYLGNGDSNTCPESVDAEKHECLRKRNGQFDSTTSNKRPRLDAPVVPQPSNGLDEANCQNIEDSQEEHEQEHNTIDVAAKRAEEYWTNYVNKNNTVITNTFQGLFKSTVVCKECSYVSVTYEPFMYLSVPIPGVAAQNFAVTFVSLKDRRPIKVNVASATEETVEHLKELVAREVPGFSADPSSLQDCVVVEVVDNNVARRLNDEIQLNSVNHQNRNVYIYELNDNFTEKYGRCTNTSTLSGIFSNNPPINGSSVPKTYAAVPLNYTDSEDWDKSSSPNGPPDTTTSPVNSTDIGFSATSKSWSGQGLQGNVDTTGPTPSEEEPTTTYPDVRGVESDETEFQRQEHSCVICLGDFSQADALNGFVLKHKQCDTIICHPCIQRAIAYYHKETWTQEISPNADIEKFLKCPRCNEQVRADAFVNFTTDESSSELNLVAVLLRLPLDFNNNTSKSSGRLFGAPTVVRIPSSIPAEELYAFIDEINPFPDLDATLVKVFGDGTRCSCCFNDCEGCVVEKEGIVSIPPGTALAISYNHITTEQIATVEPSDMATSNQSTSTKFPAMGTTEAIVDIHDCLRTFSEVEHLDEQNPWHCPRCEKSQRATKTMTISRFPDYLIIHLKRFLYQENSTSKVSTKLRFPLVDLDMNAYIPPEGSCNSTNLYDLYSCVCHFGAKQSFGHYTAYAKNPVTNCWSYFNDERVTANSQPGEADYSTVYVLFFQRKGINYEIPKRTEETVIPNPPSSVTLPPAAISGPLVLYNNSGVTNSNLIEFGPGQSSASFLDMPPESNDWDSPSLVIPTNSYATTLESTVMEESNVAADHVTLNNFPHVSSSQGNNGSPSKDEGGFLMDDGFEDDNFLDQLRTNDTNDYQEASSQSAYDGDEIPGFPS